MLQNLEWSRQIIKVGEEMRKNFLKLCNIWTHYFYMLLHYHSALKKKYTLKISSAIGLCFIKNIKIENDAQ